MDAREVAVGPGERPMDEIAALEQPPTFGRIVCAKHLAFAYPSGVQAIGDLSFDLSPGEILAVVGPSGCGKSTLLRLLADLKKPNHGTVERHFVGGGRHSCSMVFQEDTLLPWLKAKDQVGLYYRFRHKGGRKVREHVAELLEMVGLSNFANYYPSHLSGGMQRRIAVLSAVAPLPELLLLDEPFVGLDEPTRIALHSDLYLIIRRLQISAVLVTHDLAEAIALSDRVLLLSRAPARVIEEYRVPFGIERDMLDLRGNADFLKIYGKLWRTLKEQLAGARDSGD